MTLNDLERQNRGFYGLCDPDREFGICILTYREHPNFQLNYTEPELL